MNFYGIKYLMANNKLTCNLSAIQFTAYVRKKNIKSERSLGDFDYCSYKFMIGRRKSL